MEQNINRSIRRINILNLFGLYNYELVTPDINTESDKFLILYGDNGSGKTTILKLVFHLLAPEDNKGHKSAAASVPFESFEIEFQDRTKVLAVRPKNKLTGSFSMIIKQPHKKEKTVDFVVREENKVHYTSEKNRIEIQNFLMSLRQLQVSLYMLSDDRTINLAGIKGPGSSVYEREPDNVTIQFDEDDETQIRQRHYPLKPEDITKYLLIKSLRRTEEWLRGKAMRSSSIGDSSVNVLYNEILRSLVSLPKAESMDNKAIKTSIEKRIKELEKKYNKFAQYGLLPRFSGKEIMKVVATAPRSHINIIAYVLDPYLKSLEKKLEAMNDVHSRIDSFVTIINRFFSNKKLSFDLHSGLSIMSVNNNLLKPHMLSSGERHLLLLFCNSLIAVDRPSILMIDEPEISLNIKWQRMLLSYLIEFISDSPVQYLFATHSLELLTKHMSRVIKLENIK